MIIINNDQPLVLSQIFTLFYAVLYGAIFTLSDRWRPFYSSFEYEPQIRRHILSFFFFALFPVFYFISTLLELNKISVINHTSLFLSFYSVAPLGFFYICWSLYMRKYSDKYYSCNEKKEGSVVYESLKWGGDRIFTRSIIVFVLFFYLFPIIATCCFFKISCFWYYLVLSIISILIYCARKFEATVYFVLKLFHIINPKENKCS
jgi:hypothetical protein